MEGQWGHRPVLLDECIAGLALRPDGIYVDGTLGRAGHSVEIAKRLTSGRLIGIDRDGDAIAKAQERLSPYRECVTLVRGNFAELPQILNELSVEKVDGILCDLGVSSPQLDDGARGFSYRYDAPLDMRMDRSAPLTAREIVNTWEEKELRRIFSSYGEERYAPQIARAIVRARERAPVETTLALSDLICGAMPAAARREKQHPAKRVFQALRIAVNDELGALEPLVRGAAQCLACGGRLCVITFHSLEDRIIKQTIKELARGCTCPSDFPVCVCGKQPILEPVTRKPVLPTEEEVSGNPRARSAKLRIAQRTAFVI